MRRCRSKASHPTSQISGPGRMSHLSHLSHPSQMFAMFAVFPMFPLFAMFAMFPMFPLFAAFPRTRDARKKTKHREMRNSVSEARASARAYQPKRHSQSGIWNSNSRLKPRLKTQSRFTCFKCFRRFNCFRHFIRFTSFSRFRCICSWQKMKHPTSKETASPERTVALDFARGWL